MSKRPGLVRALTALFIALFALAAGRVHAAGPWSAPQNLSAHTEDVEQAALTIDSAGRVHAVWSDGEALFHALNAGSGWGSPQEIGGGASPDLAADGLGRVLLVFTSGLVGQEEEEVYFTFWRNGQGWAPAVNLSNTETASQSPAIAAASDGSLAVAWSEWNGEDAFNIYLAQPGEGDVWAVAPIAGVHGTEPALHLDASGRLLLAWQDVIDAELWPEMDIHFRLYAEGAWGDITIPNPTAVQSVRATIIAQAGVIYLAWEEQEAGGERIYVARSTDGVFWNTDTGRSGAEASLDPALAIDSGGGIHLAYTTADAARHLRRDPSPRGWWPASSIATGQNGAQGADMAATDRVHVIWLAEGQSGYQDVWYAQRSIETGMWSFVPLIWKK